MLRISRSLDMGHHVLLNMYGCERVKLQDLDVFSGRIEEVLIEADAEIVTQFGHKFGPPGHGFTYFALLTTSHFSIHTWPEWGSATVDVFTCGEVDTGFIVRSMVEYFGSLRHTLQDVER